MSEDKKMPMIETKEQIKLHLDLQKKPLEELQDLCESQGLATEGNKQALIEKLIFMKGPTQQISVFQAQAIPLRTRDNDSKPLEGAVEAMKKWRQLIFNGKGNQKEFQLLNSDSKPYKLSMRYVVCPSKSLLAIMRRGWILPLESHRELLTAMKTNPDSFSATVVQKPDANGKSWLMLHVEPKVQKQ